VFTALTDAIVMLLGGEPIGERFIEWNSCRRRVRGSSRRRRIEGGTDEAARARRHGVHSAAAGLRVASFRRCRGSARWRHFSAVGTP
jgi:hypothetical protein